MRNLSVFQRLALIVGILSTAFLTLAAAQIWVLRNAIIEERKSKLVDMVGSVELMVKRFDEKAKAGEMSLEAAQASAAQAIIGMRWGEGDYFGVYRYDGLTVAHGNPKNVGQMRLGYKDPTGRLLVAEIIEVTKTKGHGWVDYIQTRAGKDEPLTKLAYIGGFEPWQWSIQAGTYTDDIDVVVRRNATWMAGAGLAGLLLAGFLAFWIGRGITRPLAAICAAMDRLAGGQFDSDVPFAERKNEIGRIARSLVVFKTSLIEAERLRAEQDEMKVRAAAQRKADMDRMADGFEHSVGGIVGAVASAAGAMHGAARSLSGTAGDATHRSEVVAAAANEATTNVQSVASSTEELSSSIQEIAQRVAQSAAIAHSAVDQAGRTNATVESLAHAAQKIGEVVGLIQAIAGQTNLLALNATIEAARAGEAGKGFAVVASEVKTLATETAKATEEIAAQIQAIQGATSETVGAIREIGATIGQINEIAASIASAVEEQGAATQEISKSIQSAAQGTQQVTSNIAGVSRASGEVTEAATQVLGAADELAAQSDQLKQEVQTFLATVRAA